MGMRMGLYEAHNHNLMIMMKTAVLEHFGDTCKVVQTEPPRPQAHEVLVEIKTCGFCHTDIHAIKGDWSSKPRLPLIPGHEGIGIVTEVS